MKLRHSFATLLLAGSVAAGLADAPAAQASAPPAAEGASTPAAAAYQYATGKVTSRHKLAIRSRPTTHSKRVGWLKPGQRFFVKCWTRGQKVRHTRVWYRMGYSSPKDYVSGAYVKIVKGKVRHC
ncbi:hypothetical protein HUT06_07300 [Actinomadura sp. NAK00032]|uniref:hypothetical protein n=1 Tax=Actinomadura sp. NAK00032 TaxID=2742128 RepID=UPI001590584C|nr:hypothetical protein [Actinomadura sp. NAK00032]QKW33861.1 hypothetical protein HUT06_07300 [Actinomadura sp. NAK00032]